MIYEEPKTGSFAVPAITILLVMAASVLLLILHANGGPRQQGRIFVQVQQPDGATR